MTAKLTRVRVAGFRSLREVTLDLTPVTLLIGPNGSGKSNLLSVLRMVPLMRTQLLRRFVGEQGGASALLHYGASVTRELEIGLDFDTGPDGGCSGYHARLGYAAGDTLVFLDEAVFGRVSPEGDALSVPLGAGHAESVLAARARQPGTTTELTVNDLIARMSFFHFHDTSPTSPLRQNARRADDRYLRSDGSNLAAFLYRLRASESDQVRPAWNRISGLVRRIAPFIKDLEPGPVSPENPDSPVRLYWTDERDHRFDVHDLSDGTLRAIALIAALAQPADSLRGFITIDEPELGLHPAALSLVAALVESVSKRCQVLLSTQSPALLDEFSPGEVVVTERRGGETGFRRLSAEALAGWLDDYSLSDLYGLPSNFPGLDQRASITDTRVRCELLEGDMGVDIGDGRFIPYLQRHEFEALVLAGLPVLRDLLDDRDDLAGLKALEKDIRGLSPEDVDDGIHTAPSKRLKRFIPSYVPEEPGASAGKSYFGPLVTAATGLGVLRERCPRFGAGLARLEALEDGNP